MGIFYIIGVLVVVLAGWVVQAWIGIGASAYALQRQREGGLERDREPRGDDGHRAQDADGVGTHK
jgi:hypothetical protein